MMKGRSKGKEQKDSKDCRLQIPELTTIDHTTSCPKYTAVLQQTSDEDYIDIEDLDDLQFELESLLVAVSKRMFELNKEMQNLSSWQDKKEKWSGGKPEAESNSKKGRSSDGKPAKKFKDNSGKAHAVTATTAPRPKAKVSQVPRIPENETVEPPKPRNDAPSRFWASIEPYCVDIGQEHVKFLEEWLKINEDNSEYYKIPSVEQHYALKWSCEEIQEQQRQGAKANDDYKDLSNSSSFNSADAEQLLKKFEECSELDDGTQMGPFAHCLLSCLIEENAVPPLDEDEDSPDANGEHKSKISLVKSIKPSIMNCLELERRIRKELVDIGLLDLNSSDSDDPEDEIATELKSCQRTLRALIARNVVLKSKMIKRAQEEMSKQAMRKKLQIVDGKVMEMQHKVLDLKKKNKNLTKKDREEIMEILKERKAVVEELRSKGLWAV